MIHDPVAAIGDVLASDSTVCRRRRTRGAVLRLNVIRENGFRAAVSQVWIVERADLGRPVTAPTSTLDAPLVRRAASARDAGDGERHLW